MNKWSYLNISFSCDERSVVILYSPIGMEQLSQLLPSGLKVNKLVLSGVPKINVNSLDEAKAIECQILDYLGSQGWEAYAHENTTYYLKRLTA